MTVSPDEISVQDADLLPNREALQAAPMDVLNSIFSGVLGLVPASSHVPANVDSVYPSTGVYGHHNGFLHAGPRPMPAIM